MYICIYIYIYEERKGCNRMHHISNMKEHKGDMPEMFQQTVRNKKASLTHASQLLTYIYIYEVC